MTLLRDHREKVLFGSVVALVWIRTITDGGVPWQAPEVLKPSVLIGLVLIALGGVMLITRRRHARVFLVLAALAAISAAIGTPEFGLVTWVEWIRTLSVLAAVAVIVNLKEPVRPSVGALVIELVAAVPAIVALVQFIAGTGLDVQGDIRSTGTLAHPNTAGLLFAIAALCAAVRLSSPARRWYDVVGALVFVAALATTASFGSIATLLVMLVVLALVTPRLRVRTKVVIAVGTVLAPIGIALSPLGMDRLRGLWESTGDRGTAVDSFSWRIETWGQVWTTSLQTPFFGRGLGATNAETIVPGNLPHNEYLRALVELGWVGAVIVLALAVALTWTFARSLRTRSNDGAPFALALLAGLAANALVANTFLYSVPLYVVSIVIATCLTAVDRTTTATPIAEPVS